MSDHRHEARCLCGYVFSIGAADHDRRRRPVMFGLLRAKIDLRPGQPGAELTCPVCQRTRWVTNIVFEAIIVGEPVPSS